MLTKNLITNTFFSDGVEITEAKYATSLAEIKAKAAWIDGICAGTASIDDVPTSWMEEIIQRVAERQAQEEDDPELTAEEALSIIVGGAV